MNVQARSDFPEFFVEQGYKKGAEIGVYKGEFTNLLCEVGLFVYAIDPWESYDEEKKQERHNFVYGHTQRFLKDFQNCKIIRKKSMDAVKEFDDESLDFVYIDGNHTFKYIACDLVEWSKKVRVGGVVSGHDYSGPSSQFVRHVVDAYVAAYKINNFRTFRKRKNIKERGDKYHSWMWIKE